MAEMRPHIEMILQRYGINDPPSQSYRARLLLDSPAIKSAPGTPVAERRVRMRDSCRLQAFLAVHQTVVIMERVDRDPDHWDIWGEYRD